MTKSNKQMQKPHASRSIHKCSIVAAVVTFSFCLTVPLFSLSIAEKRASLAANNQEASRGDLSSLKEINREIAAKNQAIKGLYTSCQEESQKMMAEKKSPEEIKQALNDKLAEIKKLREDIKNIEEEWKNTSDESPDHDEEGLWHQPDTTIGQLVIDYGSCDYIYLMPPEIGSLKVHVSSQLSVPRSSWGSMLELILAHYGIGIKQLNPFLRQLYFLRLNQSGLVAITDDRLELQLIPENERVCFVLLPEATELRRIYQFLEKFSPQEQMNVQILGNNLIIVGYAKEVSEILKIYDFISSPKHVQEYRLVGLQKAHSDEVAKILLSIFDGESSRMPMMDNGQDGGPDRMPSHFSSDNSFGFRVITIKHPSQSLFLLGRRDQIEKACQIIQEIEDRIGEIQDKNVYWYACKHSEAEELADVLSQVYNRMISSPDAFAIKDRSKLLPKIQLAPAINPQNQDGGADRLIVQPPSRIGISSDQKKKRVFEKNENFIVDTKTNSIVMVVESNVLPKLRELLKKLDVPKKMVQIEVLLFEKKINDSNSFGLNLLKLGEAAAKRHSPRLFWNNTRKHPENRGILGFTFSRNEHNGLPAFDIAYNFLLTQEDIQINANPTVTTVNQTATKIAVVDQISINTGVVEIDTTKATRLKDSYVREEFGITIVITPTIHAKIDDEDDPNAVKYLTLATDLIFDTTRPSRDSRPDVTRRNIKNEVRVADGETVILGGLRRKMAYENQESVPFLGEIPGVGKLFSITSFTESSTEMFIFLTPRIVPEKSEEYKEMRKKELLKRPGDIPEFLKEVVYARTEEKKKLFERGMKLLLGHPEEIKPVPRNL